MASISGGSVVWQLDIDDTKFKSKLKNASDSIKSSSKSTATETSKNWGKMGATMGAVAGITQSVFTRAMSAVSDSVGGAIKRVDTLNNFPKIMSNMGISADDSSRVIQELSDELTGLPTTLDGASLAVQRLTASTGDIDEAKDVFLALNNAILAGGAPMELQAGAMEQFSQSFAKGKPDMMEWRSLTSAMPAQLSQLATAMGQTNADALGEALRTGEVSMDEFSKALVDLNQNGTGEFSSFEEQAKNSTGGIQTGIANMNTAISRGLANIFEAIGQENISRTIGNIGKAFEKAMKLVVKGFKFVTKYKDVFAPIAVAILTVVAAMTIWNAITKVIAISQAILNAVMSANPIGIIILAIAALVAGLVYFFTQTETGKRFLETFFNVAKKVFDGVKRVAQSVWNWIKTKWPLLLTILLGPIGLAVALIIKNFDKVKSVVLGVWNWIKRNWKNILTFLTGPIGLAVRIIIGNFSRIKSAVLRVYNWIKGAFSTIAAIGTSILRGAVNAIMGFAERTINGFINMVNGAIGAINRIPGVSIGQIGTVSLPRLAKGGIVPATAGGRLAILGEGGQDEAVIPLNKLKDFTGGNETNQTVNISTVVLGDRSAAQEFFEQLNQDTLIVNNGLTPIQGVA